MVKNLFFISYCWINLYSFTHSNLGFVSGIGCPPNSLGCLPLLISILRFADIQQHAIVYLPRRLEKNRGLPLLCFSNGLLQNKSEEQASNTHSD